MALDRIFQLLDAAISAGQDVALVTIVRAEGSTPRETGASMLVFPKNIMDETRIDGTVGGGKLEALAIEAAQDALAQGQNRLCTFDLSEGPGGIGMACSGVTELFIQVFKALPEILILGAGHVGQKIAEVAHIAGFRTKVADDRAEFANSERFPHSKLMLVEPHKAIELAEVTERTSIVIVTRGHSLDRECLEAALPTKACYIGMIGSRSKVPLTFSKLVENGLDPEGDPRVYSPIGLDLGGKSPGEIAVSVVSEILKCVHGHTGKHHRIHREG